MKLKSLALLVSALLLLGANAAQALPGPGYFPGPRHVPGPAYAPHGPAHPGYHRPYPSHGHYQPYRGPRGAHRPGPRTPHPHRP